MAVLATSEISRLHTPHLRVGTCSWRYDSWKGLVYDPDKPYGPNDYLPDYARYLDTVEIDQWFWSLFAGGIRLPDPDVVKQYVESVPDDFTFSVKVPNSITLTHPYSKQPRGGESLADTPNPHFLDVDLFNRFIEMLGSMHDKLGPVMFQFEYLDKKKMPSLAAFLDRLDVFFAQAPRGFMYAVETRNPNYLQKEFFDFLRSHHLGSVLLDGYYMPPLSQVVNQFDTRTAGFSVIRLHGPDRAGIEEQTDGDWSKIVDPKDGGLTATADLIRANEDADVATYVNVNNHYEGCAPLTIQRLAELY